MTAGVITLPDEVLDNVLSYISYDEVSRLRMINRTFDNACQRVLNQGFYRVEKFHALCLRKVKEQLPRRESERRKHPLSVHCDILTAIETRLSLLGMTFMKYVDLKYCCFIPGKVLDEIFKILRFVSNTATPPRSHEILQELRDISSMAMEHFDEKIAPAFRNRRNGAPKLSVTSNGALTGSPLFLGSPSTSTFRAPSFNHELVKVNLGYRQLQSKYVELRKENIECRRKMMEYRKKLNDMDRKVSEQNASIVEQATRFSEQDGKISELNRKFVEFDKYISDLLNLKEREPCMEEQEAAEEEFVFQPAPPADNQDNANDSTEVSLPQKRKPESTSEPRRKRLRNLKK